MNHPRMVQSLAWLAFLALVVLGGTSSSYIAAWQGGILLATLGVFALLLLLDLLLRGSSDDHGHDHDGHEHEHDDAGGVHAWLQTGVHLLPLCLLLTMGVTSLGSQSIHSLYHPRPGLSYAHSQPLPQPRASPSPQRPVTVIPTVAQTSAPRETAAHAQNPSPSPFAVPASPQGATAAITEPVKVPAPTTLTLLDLYYPTDHPGVVRVEVVGRLTIPTPAMLKDLPPGVEASEAKLFLYRFLVTCCAADAQPVLVVLKHPPEHGITADAWVRITGVWLPPKELGDVSGIVVEDMQATAAPADPYLHPVWR